MRTSIPLLMTTVLVVTGASCSKKTLTGSPWTRWGMTRPAAEAGAEVGLASAHRLLYQQKFDSAQSAYKQLITNFPQNAEAHLGLSMACRYLGKRDTAFSEARAALVLDSHAVGVLLNYGNLLMPMRTGPISDMSDSARYAESERCLLEAAASPHPFGAHAHIELWASYMGQGRLYDARQQAAELSEKLYYPQPLLDFAYNLLVGLPPNAILVTRGDNDTYPLWALQNAGKPFRPDVLVANLALLNIPAVAKMMRDSLGLPVSLTDEQIDDLGPIQNLDEALVLTPAQQVADNVIANVTASGRAVYFTATTRNEVTDRYPGRIVLEGLVKRVTGSEASSPVDFDRVAENLNENYRLDWPKQLPAWPENMSPLTRSFAPLAASYAEAFLQLAVQYDSLGSEAKAAEARKQAATWLARSGKIHDARPAAEE